MVGLPMITTVVGGLNDYSADDRNAVHVPIGEAPVLADAIAELVSNEARRRRLGTSAAERMAELYSAQTARQVFQEIGARLFVPSSVKG